jgi:AcrR family transcriptional regulator
MSVAHHRSKQPEQLRAQLLDVAISIIVVDGYEALTLDKVAKRAGVSKGGLQYHFASKAALMDAVCDALCQMYAPIFDAALAEEPEGPSRITRAYIRVSFTDLDPLCTKAMLILTLAMPEFARKHGEWLTELMAQDEANAPESAQILLLCRLAADGFWLATTSNALQFDASTRIALRDRLLSLTEAA